MASQKAIMTYLKELGLTRIEGCYINARYQNCLNKQLFRVDPCWLKEINLQKVAEDTIRVVAGQCINKYGSMFHYNYDFKVKNGTRIVINYKKHSIEEIKAKIDPIYKAWVEKCEEEYLQKMEKEEYSEYIGEIQEALQDLVYYQLELSELISKQNLCNRDLHRSEEEAITFLTQTENVDLFKK